MTASSAANREAALRFLRTAFEPDDWIAVFLKSYQTGRTTQRVGPLALVVDARFQAWLRAENAARANVYVSINAVTPGKRSRRRDAVRAIRHVFLDADRDGARVLAAIDLRRDLPRPSYVLQSSPNRVHVLWRAADFTVDVVERLQKQLARELHTDPAATPCSQTTRLPGFFNHKYRPAHLVTVEYRSSERRYAPGDFPAPPMAAKPTQHTGEVIYRPTQDVVRRARRYLEAVPAAIAGQHGDLHTFRVSCRLVRGFALTDADALEVLVEWNARCQPPWSERDLIEKLRRARRYGHEPIAGLLEAQS